MTRVWGGALALGLVVCVLGCDAVPLTAPLWTEAERREQAARYLNEGLQALDADGEQADRLLGRAVALQDDPEGLGVVTVAQRLLEEGRAPKAGNLLRDAIEQPLLRQNPLVFGVLARVYFVQGADDDARRSEQQAEELVSDALAQSEKVSPDDEMTRRERVRQFLVTGRYCDEFGSNPRRTLQLLRAAVRLGPDNTALLSPLDLRALSALGIALARHPELALDRSESIRYTRLAAQQEPSATLLHAYGFALLQSGDTRGAQRVLREAVEQDTDNPEIHFHLGQTYAQQAKYDQAALALDRALMLRPHHAEAALARKALPNPLPVSADEAEEDLN